MEERRCSPEILETPTVTLDDVQPEDGHEDENLPIHSCIGAATVAGDGVPEGDGAKLLVTILPKVSATRVLWRWARCSKRTKASLAWGPAAPTMLRSLSPLHVLVRPWLLTTAFASSSCDLSESYLAIVHVSTFTIVEILDKRSGGSGVEYQFELELL